MKHFIRDISALLLAALVTAAVATPIAAQSSAGIVLKGGLSYGDVSNSGVFPGGASTRNGAALGVGLVTRKPIGFGIEALYAQRGIVGSPGNSRELDYIDVPLYLRIGAQTPVIQPFAYAGPQVSFELRCDADGGDCPSGRERTSYAGTIGGGLRFPRLAGVTVEGRYVYGLTDLKLGTISDTESYRTRSFMLLFGLAF
jgi:hypothetical protein